MGFAALGYDYASVNIPGFRFAHGNQDHKQTISQNEGSLIHDRDTFDKYPWPDPETLDLSVLDHLADIVPRGMKLMIMGPGGVLENATSLVGFEDLCYMLVDDEQLSHDLFEAIGSRIMRYYERCLQHDVVGGLTGNDDWGFKILQCHRLVHQHLSNPELNVRLLAQWIACSPDYLSHCFHTETGITLTRFINSRRIQQAQTLLDSSTLNISEIAHACGYTDAGYFTRLFKRIADTTPLEYRKRRRAEKIVSS